MREIWLKCIASILLAIFVFGAAPAAFAAGKPNVRKDAQKFIDDYTATWSMLRYESAQAEWRSNTYIVEGDDANAKATVAAAEKVAAFTGSKANIDAATAFLKQKDKLTPIQVLQLQAILYKAADNPEIAQELVA